MTNNDKTTCPTCGSECKIGQKRLEDMTLEDFYINPKFSAAEWVSIPQYIRLWELANSYKEENEEQARLLGISGSVEAKLRVENERLRSALTSTYGTFIGHVGASALNHVEDEPRREEGK